MTQLLESRLGLNAGELGVLAEVDCEAIERIDVLLTYERSGQVRKVGIEAKFDHELTGEQLDREAAAVGDGGYSSCWSLMPKTQLDSPSRPPYWSGQKSLHNLPTHA